MKGRDRRAAGRAVLAIPAGLTADPAATSWRLYFLAALLLARLLHLPGERRERRTGLRRIGLLARAGVATGKHRAHFGQRPAMPAIGRASHGRRRGRGLLQVRTRAIEVLVGLDQIVAAIRQGTSAGECGKQHARNETKNAHEDSDPVPLRRAVLRRRRSASPQRSYPICAIPNSATNDVRKLASNNRKMISRLDCFNPRS